MLAQALRSRGRRRGLSQVHDPGVGEERRRLSHRLLAHAQYGGPEGEGSPGSKRLAGRRAEDSRPADQALRIPFDQSPDRLHHVRSILRGSGRALVVPDPAL